MTNSSHRIRWTLLGLCLALLLGLALPLTARAQTGKVVRVGWYESPFNYTDGFGRRCGFGYEYQQKVAAYTGWTYEYVEGSWPELLAMLREGSIDLLSDVSYTEERAGQIRYASLPMGTESYYVFVAQGNETITAADVHSLDGKTVGVNQGSIQKDLFLQWAADNEVHAALRELSGSEEESVQLLLSGEIDAYVTIDVFGDGGAYLPVIRIGQSDFFFAVSMARADLLQELNTALIRIQDEDRNYNQDPYDQYIRKSGTNAFLPAHEAAWLEAHGPIRVGYLDNYLPFCAAERGTGELTGGLRDFLDAVSANLQNAALDFETRAYPTLNAALEALQAGELDCVFPVYLSAYDAEVQNVMVTNPFIETEVYAAVRKAEYLGLYPEAELRAALNGTNPNFVTFLHNDYPNWSAVYYADLDACFRAVAAGEADCALFNSYRLLQTEAAQDRSRLTTLATGESMDFSFAVRQGDSELYYILNKSAGLVPRAQINAALTGYSYPGTLFSLSQFLRDNLFAVLGVLLGLSLLIVWALLRRSHRVKAELEARLALQQQVMDRERTERRANALITAMAADYRSVFLVNLDRDESICYRANPSIQAQVQEGDVLPFREGLARYGHDYVIPEDREAFLRFVAPESIRAALAEKSVITHRYRTLRQGVERYENLRVAGVQTEENRTDRDIHAVVMGFSDVDDEMRETLVKQQALADALEQAKAANAAKTSFLSSVSHEIRTPMNAIIGLDAIALKDPDLSPQTRDYLEKIGGSAKHLLNLINDILDMSRIESGRLALRSEEFSFPEMLEQINTIIHGQCRDKGLDYECRLMGRVKDYYIGDDGKLKQALINILGNAVKFTPAPGSVTFLVEPLPAYKDKTPLRFIIRDTGVGMHADFLPHIFDAFSQEDEGKANKFGSTGLGLAITKNVVEAMNGRIEVESEKGVGSTFTVTVTLKASDRTGTPDDAPRPQDLRVLIIDDDPVACEHAQSVLDEAGIYSDACTSGQEAYRLLELAGARRQPYSLILVDWKMPLEDAVEVTRNIRERFDTHSPIIILTAYNWDAILEEAAQAGVDSFLAKPLFVSNVLQEFRQALLRKGRSQAEAPRAELEGRHILLAEDMELNAEIVIELLSMRDVTVDLAENGQIAVDLFAASAPGSYDAVLMDIRMPVMDGHEATRQIRALDRPDAKQIPIIALSANALDEDVQRSLQAGMNAHLSKPVEPERLFDTLEVLIGANPVR
ncbi:MAG: response regulator [Oscillospiraceae bacterium]|nr:response regulator [Oscillospiraceae bacterium]